MLFNGDCYEILREKIADNSVDLVVTDPPYDIKSSLNGGGVLKEKHHLKDLNALDCLSFEPEPFLELLTSKFKNGFNGYFFCNKSLVYRYCAWAVKHNFLYDILVMSKANPVPCVNNHHLSDLEYIVLVRDKGAYFNSKLGDMSNYKKHYSVVIGNGGAKSAHPAKKPVELIKRFVRISSVSGDVVLDPFMGSGTTGVACRELGREFIGIEKEPKYFDMASVAIKGAFDKREVGLFGDVYDC